jgi:undecaprenyl-diphosphatase
MPPWAAVFVPLALIDAALLAHLSKLAIERPLPDLFPALIAIPADASFTSAHAMQSAAFVLAYIVRPAGRVRPAGALALGIVAALVGISRVYPQVRSSSDVLFSAAAAILWVRALRALPVWQERIR